MADFAVRTSFGGSLPSDLLASLGCQQTAKPPLGNSCATSRRLACRLNCMIFQAYLFGSVGSGCPLRRATSKNSVALCPPCHAVHRSSNAQGNVAGKSKPCSRPSRVASVSEHSVNTAKEVCLDSSASRSSASCSATSRFWIARIRAILHCLTGVNWHNLFDINFSLPYASQNFF